jgi:hypothetical protein
MARSIATIKEVIRQKKNDYTTLSPILFKEEGGSSVGVLNNIADVVSINQNLHEQIFDQYRTDVEGVITSGTLQTNAWLQKKVLEFQYSTTTPQYVQLDTDTYIANYPIINEELQIITRCAVITQGGGVVSVKVAKSDPPTVLSGAEKTALESYLNIITGAGIKPVVLNEPSDKLRVNAIVYYDGQFYDTIQSEVEATINTYLANLPFNGEYQIIKMVDALQAVNGFKDIVISSVQARKDSVVSPSTVVRNYAPYSGYIVEDPSALFSATITYTAI